MVERRLFAISVSEVSADKLKSALKNQASFWIEKSFDTGDSSKNPILFFIDADVVNYGAEIVQTSKRGDYVEIFNVQELTADSEKVLQEVHGNSIRNHTGKKYGSVDRFLDKIGFELSNKSNKNSAKISEVTKSEPQNSNSSSSRVSETSVNKRPNESEPRETISTTRKQRDSTFRSEVKSAYNETCAFCGSNRYTTDGNPEVEAAHIKSVKHDGPAHIQNGIALCKLHHWAFDGGWLSISNDYTISVKKKRNKSEYEEFAELHNQQIKLPERQEQYPSEKFLQWHREHYNFE